MPKTPSFKFHPLTAERWPDLEKLFGPRGACGGCWCMTWRLKRSEFQANSGEGNRKAFKKIVTKGEIPGILAYDGDEPVGWCAVAPREAYPSLERSKVLQPIDEEPVWSVSCFFIAKGYRQQGLSVKLLEAVVKHVKKQGGKIVEGYPVETPKGKQPDAWVWTGLAGAFEKAGFVEAARRSKTRPVMRYYLKKR